ncbi:MAG: DUF393 domain-containing protein [Gemmatales bacterium]|nr:DUF393 domain-containing protein [Gemmatales bacterium]MDW7993322.1 DUF393 domain-containing protein [Gemmatales bacterium]
MATEVAQPETIQATLPRDKPVVIYDGECPLCVGTVALLRRLDVLGRLAYQNAREPFELPSTRPAIEPDRLLKEMHVVTPGTERRRVYTGYYAFRWLAWQLPALWPIVPLLYLPGAAWLGERIYSWVARNRFRFLSCSTGVCQLPHRRPTTDARRRGKHVQ